MTKSSKKAAAQWGIGIAAGVGAAMVGKAIMDNQSSMKKTVKRASKAFSHLMSSMSSSM